MEMFISASIAKNIEPKRKFVSPAITTTIILDNLKYYTNNDGTIGDKVMLREKT